MRKQNRPGAGGSARAGEIVLAGTLPHTIRKAKTQRRHSLRWTVDRNLNVTCLEVLQ
jgi:hypothetical protein